MGKVYEGLGLRLELGLSLFTHAFLHHLFDCDEINFGILLQREPGRLMKFGFGDWVIGKSFDHMFFPFKNLFLLCLIGDKRKNVYPFIVLKTPVIEE